jgi:hypothetical protein
MRSGVACALPWTLNGNTLGGLMALVYLDMACSLCGEPIGDGELYVACAHFIYEGPLSPQSDSAMHRHCFDIWEHREEFTRRYREFWASLSRYHGWHDSKQDWPDSGTSVMRPREVLLREAIQREPPST